MGFRKSNWGEEIFQWDDLTHAACKISHQHRMIHEGFFYQSTGRAASVANGADLDVLFKVPALINPHVRVATFTFGNAPDDLKCFEGTTVSADGSALTSVNMNRTSLNVPGMTLFQGPTVTADGTLIHDRHIPSGGAEKKVDVGATAAAYGQEVILASSTNYLIRATNDSGGTIIVTWAIMWYEIDFEVA